MFIKYINEPIISLYIMESTISEVGSHYNFKFNAIDVVVEFQSNVSNLCILSIEYFPWLNKISSAFLHTYNPKNHFNILEL